MNLDQTRFDRAPNYSKIKDPAEDLREDRYYVEPHFNFGYWIRSSRVLNPNPKSLPDSQIKQTVGRIDRDALSFHVNVRANLIREWDQQLPAIASRQNQEIRPARSHYSCDWSQLSPIGSHHFRPDYLSLKELPIRKGLHISFSNHQATASQTLRSRHCVITFKLQYHALVVKPMVLDF